MANIQERAGSVLVRLGGNTQEYAVMVDALPDGHTIAKQKAAIQQTVRRVLLSLSHGTRLYEFLDGR